MISLNDILLNLGIMLVFMTFSMLITIFILVFVQRFVKMPKYLISIFIALSGLVGAYIWMLTFM